MIIDERAALTHGFLTIRAQRQLARNPQDVADWDRTFDDLLTGYDELDKARRSGDPAEIRRREKDLEDVLRDVSPANPHVLDPQRWLEWGSRDVEEYRKSLVAQTERLVEQAGAAPKPPPITDPQRLAQLEKLAARMYGPDPADQVDAGDPVASARRSLERGAAGTQGSDPVAGSEDVGPSTRAAKPHRREPGFRRGDRR